MISIDNAQNDIDLPGHIDDGREWTDWLLKKANEQRKKSALCQAEFEKFITNSPQFNTNLLVKYQGGEYFSSYTKKYFQLFSAGWRARNDQ
ncbi:hypothetical protein AB204_14805 [Xenorhabdus khoisanae]|uniref:Uncharacterized protein n=1 Tax=Xenorhabdus khoisanae TaxID=880157 RepID=A0A0J5FPY9_9GAMM|nr:hypothetical protein [Xenorhabdus khoisanae]KMJ44348.1 hypothetical protein AB204_14805 [Xenorhabdus khoisanae]